MTSPAPTTAEVGWEKVRTRHQPLLSHRAALCAPLSTSNRYEPLADSPSPPFNEDPCAQPDDSGAPSPIARASTPSPNKKNRRHGEQSSNGRQGRIPPIEASSRTSDELANIDPRLRPAPHAAQGPSQSDRLASDDTYHTAVNKATQRKRKPPKKEAASTAAKRRNGGRQQGSTASTRGEPAAAAPFIPVDPSSRTKGWDEPSRNSPQTRSAAENASRAKMKEKGVCVNCASTKHRCDLEDLCWKCNNIGMPCIRDIKTMWLWKDYKIILDSILVNLLRRDNNKARNAARNTSFPGTRAFLEDPALISHLKAREEFVVQVTDQGSGLQSLSQGQVSCRELYRFCVGPRQISGYTGFRSLEKLDKAFVDHSKNNPACKADWLPGDEGDAEAPLIQTAKGLVGRFAILEAIPTSLVFVKSGDADLARSVMICMSTFFAISIARDAEALLENVVSELRRKETHRPKDPRRFAEIRTAVALYYRVLTKLQSMHRGCDGVDKPQQELHQDSGTNFVSAIFADLKEEAARSANGVKQLFDLTQRLAKRNHMGRCRTMGHIQAVETLRKGSERHMEHVNTKTLQKYLSEFVPLLSTTELSVSIHPMPGLVQPGVFGNNPFAAETLFKDCGTRNLRSRDDLVAVMESGPKLKLDDPVKVPSLESSVASLRDLKVNESTRATKRHGGSSMEAGNNSGDRGTAGTPTLAEQFSTASTVCGVPALSQGDRCWQTDGVKEPLESKEAVLGGITGPYFDDGFRRRLSPTPPLSSSPTDADVYHAVGETVMEQWERDLINYDGDC